MHYLKHSLKRLLLIALTFIFCWVSWGKVQAATITVNGLGLTKE